VVLDASGSSDPLRVQLSFSWTCVTGDNCNKAVSNILFLATARSSPIVTIHGGVLSVGSYTFQVNVSRNDASSVASAHLQMVVENTPPVVVSMLALPRKISPELPFIFNASIVESAAGVAPVWKAWRLVG
jgi:hypothetical protein